MQNITSKMPGKNLYTIQTDIVGRPFNKFLIFERLFSRREYYFGIIDKYARGPLLIGSSQGSMTIDDVAKEILNLTAETRLL